MVDVTQILHEIESGQIESANRLLPIVYSELRKLADHRMATERTDHTLDATGLVHEAYIRLVDTDRVQHWNSRGHFFAAAAEAMRRILINHARDKARLKRGGDRRRIDLDMIDLAATTAPEVLISIDEALDRLTQENESCGQLVKLRFYAGLSVDEAAQSMGVSSRTAKRYWAYSRAWLADALMQDATPIP
jgi:RNA polymerase sigma factor (TIGR02999 family)